MVYKSIALALAASSLVAAQTFSLCDPTKGDKCPANPAFGECKKKVHEFDFTKVASGDGWAKDENFNKFWLPDAGVKVDNSPLSIDSTNGAVLTITKPEQAPLLKSKKYLFFGEVEVTVQAAPGAGIVTSIVLESDDRDEIDWEWVGGDQAGVQSNFFSKGANEYKNGRTHGIAFNPTAGLHTYKITWTADTITFAVDGAVIRTATSGEVENYKKWPQTPCQLKLGTWVGGKASLPKGTIDWAGGLADFNNAPFVAAYKSVKITDYCGGSSDSASSYEYTDASGDVTSIKVNGGSPIDDPKDASSTSSGTLKPTESKTSGGSSPTDGSKTNNGNNSGSSNTPAPDAPGAGAITKMSSTLAGLVFLGYLILA